MNPEIQAILNTPVTQYERGIRLKTYKATLDSTKKKGFLARLRRSKIESGIMADFLGMRNVHSLDELTPEIAEEYYSYHYTELGLANLFLRVRAVLSLHEKATRVFGSFDAGKDFLTEIYAILAVTDPKFTNTASSAKIEALLDEHAEALLSKRTEYTDMWRSATKSIAKNLQN